MTLDSHTREVKRCNGGPRMGGPRIARRVERERQQHAGGRAVRPEGAQPAFFFSSSPNLRRSEGCDRSLCVLRFTAFLSADMVNATRSDRRRCLRRLCWLVVPYTEWGDARRPRLSNNARKKGPHRNKPTHWLPRRRWRRSDTSIRGEDSTPVWIRSLRYRAWSSIE